ncbi:MAG: cell division protein FtsA [bacterium]
MVKKDNLVVGLDIGTSKICCIIGSYNSDKEIEVIGFGIHPSYGLRKGVVVNIESTVESIKHAVQEAELMAGVTVDSVYVGIAGGHIRGINSRGVIAVSGKNREITELDVERVIEAAKAVVMPADREILHVLPQEFIIDNQDGIKKPLGLYGVRLEAHVHIVTGAVTSVQNIVRSVNRAGIEVKEIVLEQIASSEATVTQEEKDLGIVVVDIGGGTTDIATFIDGSICHSSVISLGGDHFTKDISIGLRTPYPEAEDIKVKYGCALSTMINEDEIIEVPSVGGRNPRAISRQILAEIIEPRAEELLELIARDIRESGSEEFIPGGVVMTGGASLMDGMVEVGEQIFDLPARIGYPIRVGGLKDAVNSPAYATGVGLLLFGASTSGKNRKPFSGKLGGNLFDSVFERMKEWFKEHF